jgi:hypothetical protein
MELAGLESWLTAMLGRVSKFPPLNQFMNQITPKPLPTKEEMEMKKQDHERLAREYQDYLRNKNV